MKNGTRRKTIIQCLAFLLIMAVCLSVYYRVIIPKYFTDQIYSTTTTYQGFYDLDRNTTDVLFLGSSHGSCAFLPQELYNNYGIRSYNLSCEAQSMLTSYYWLEEALRRQSPKVVVVEASRLFSDFEEGPLVADTDLTRKAFDCMRWSKPKIEAVKDICELDESQSFMSYVFPNIRYHERWNDISAKDFKYRKFSSYSELKGYTFIQEKCGEDFQGYDVSYEDSSFLKELNPLMEEYLSRITELCKSRGIEPVLMLAPAKEYGRKYSVTMEKYAADNGYRLINFNDGRLISKTGYDFPEMNSDIGHANIWGAACITDYIGRVLTEEYGLTGTTDSRWESTREYYDFMLTQAQLWYMTDIEEYKKAISDDRYRIVESASGGGTQYDVYEKRTNRQVDSAIIGPSGGAGQVLIHNEVDIY